MVFRVVTSRILLGCYQRFQVKYSFVLQGRDGGASFLRNVDNHLQENRTVPQAVRPLQIRPTFVTHVCILTFSGHCPLAAGKRVGPSTEFTFTL